MYHLVGNIVCFLANSASAGWALHLPPPFGADGESFLAWVEDALAQSAPVVIIQLEQVQ